MTPGNRLTYIYRKRRWIVLFRLLDGVGGWFHRPVSGVPDLSRARSIVVLKMDQMGDLILAEPLLAALRAVAPRARLELLVGKDRRAAAELLPEPDAVRELPVRLQVGGPRVRLGGLLAAVRETRAAHPDIIIAAKEEPLTVLLAALIGAPTRVGFREGGLGFLLTHVVPADDDLHQSHVLAALAGSVDAPCPFPAIPLRPRDRETAATLLDSMGRRNEFPLVIVHPGSGVLSRRWPWVRFAETMDEVSRQRPADFLILRADPGDAPTAPRLALASQSMFLDGELDLGVLAALLASGSVLLGNESGPSHLASAVGTPAVVPFVSGNSARRWGPGGERSVVIEGKVGIGPSVDRVAEAVLRVLEAGERSAHDPVGEAVRAMDTSLGGDA